MAIPADVFHAFSCECVDLTRTLILGKLGKVNAALMCTGFLQEMKMKMKMNKMKMKMNMIRQYQPHTT